MRKQLFFTVLVFLAFCVALKQGLPSNARGHCLCRRRLLLFVNMDRVANVTYHKPSSICEQEELEVIFKGRRGSRCLDPRGKQGKTIKQEMIKKSEY